MFKRMIILFPLIIGLLLLSCSLQEPEQTQTIELTFENIAEQDEVAAQAEVKNVVTMTMSLSYEAVNTHEALLESEGSLAKSAGDWVYTWDGKAHIWEKTVEEGAFYGEFFKKIYYADANGTSVEAPGQSFFMFSTNQAKGTYGFQGEFPDNKYGVTFHHVLNSVWSDMQSDSRLMSAEGLYQKTNRLIYNGRDAILKYLVNLNIQELTFERSEGASEISVKGHMIINMKPWTVHVDCDGSSTALVTIYFNRGVYNTFEQDLTEINFTAVKNLF
jgi:hypothetical protein